jgi:hypothetical protein
MTKVTKASQKGLDLNPAKFYVYEHLKPNTGEVFYIGKGCEKEPIKKEAEILIG